MLLSKFTSPLNTYIMQYMYMYFYSIRSLTMTGGSKTFLYQEIVDSYLFNVQNGKYNQE